MTDPSPQKILIPREGASDDYVTLIEINAPEGRAVQSDQILCVCETSKTAFEVISPAAGYIHWAHNLGDRIAVGAACGFVSQQAMSPAQVQHWIGLDKPQEATQQPAANTPTGAGRVSKAALDLAQRLGVDLSELAHLPLVKTKDVQDHSDLQKLTETPRQAIAHGQRLVIYGGGGHAKMCIDILKRQIGFQIEGIVDSTLTPGATVLGVSVLGGEDMLPQLRDAGVRYAVLGVGAATNHTIRSKLFNKLKSHGFEMPNIIHPTAVIEPSAQLGEGNQVMAQAYIGSDARIADNCIINVQSIVSHDAQLADNVHLAPASVLAGGVQIGTDTLIGMNTSIYMKIKVGARVTVANQTSVVANVKDDSFVRP